MRRKRQANKAKKKPAQRTNTFGGWPKSSLDPSSAEVVRVLPEDDQPVDAGQAGDATDLSGIASAESESVRELSDEGQDFEAEIVSGVERADQSEGTQVRAHVRKQDRRRRTNQAAGEPPKSGGGNR